MNISKPRIWTAESGDVWPLADDGCMIGDQWGVSDGASRSSGYGRGRMYLSAF
jgi:hypothetical protein